MPDPIPSRKAENPPSAVGEKKLFIKTYGCQMNFYDSGRMTDLLKPMGFATSDSMEDAELVILNTCHIREKASEKVYSELGRIRAEKDRMARAGKRMVIAVAGCVAQAEGAEIKARAPFVDLVVGPQAIARLPEMVNLAVVANGNKADKLALEFTTEEKFDTLPQDISSQGAAAFLTIQEGCDKFCTFCVVPYTRGAEYSRPMDAICNEAVRLVEQGAREITLLGQNVNAYHGDPKGLAGLIRTLAKIDGLERIRYTTSHPRDMDDALIEAHGEINKLMPFLHLPVQSGSDTILEEMNRKHTAAYYMKVIEKLKKARPGILFSSDFIVGFPGETEEDFEATMQLVREVNYAQAYSFTYSARPGTPAAIREDSIPKEVKNERLQRLQALIAEQQYSHNLATVGTVQKVLFDREGKQKGSAIGRTEKMHSVHVGYHPELLGKTADILITNATPHGLSGEPIENTIIKRSA